jgi:acyl dehydratase
VNDYEFPVERGHILLFARAIGDLNPAYLDAQSEEARAAGGLLAPPTFVQAAAHYDPEWRFRPRPDRPWHGSGAAPSGVPPEQQPPVTGLHAEQLFTYHRPLRPGTVLTVRTSLGAEWTKSSARSGLLRFTETLTRYIDASGAPVVTAAMVKVVRERDPGQTPRNPAPIPPKSGTPRPAGEARDGERAKLHEQVVLDQLTRTQLIQYAGASGDFNPLHTDEVYARDRAGLPTVFAHGMLIMAATARVVTDRYGPARVREFGARFQDRVWPGDVLTATAVLDDPDSGTEDGVRVRLATRNQTGALVLTGHICLAPEPVRDS